MLETEFLLPGAVDENELNSGTESVKTSLQMNSANVSSPASVANGMFVLFWFHLQCNALV